MASWQGYVSSTTALGFDKVCIIARANYAVAGTTNAKTDIATAWLEKLDDGNGGFTENQINENQELLDDWTKDDKTTFCFFGKKFNIVQKDNDQGTIV
eukprot:796275_1